MFFTLAILFATITLLVSRNIWASAASGVLTLIVGYNILPTMAFGFYGLPFVILMNSVVVFAALYFKLEPDRRFYSHNNDRAWSTKTMFPALVMIGVGLFGIVLLPFITTTPMIHSGMYRSLMSEPVVSEFSADTAPIDPKQVRIVDEDVAWLLAEKRLGEHPALGSQVDLGRMDVQLVNGKLYWVGPLNHSGFFKWWNSEGTPGYIMVSATNEQDVRLVQEVNGKAIRLKYNLGSYFGDYPERHLYSNGYMTRPLHSFSFEIDDEGNPFYVATIYEKRVGYSGKDAVGVVILDPQTGEHNEYSIDNAPVWVDRIHPEQFIESQLNYWGKYIHGWWNFSGRDMLQTTPGISLVYGEDGRAYWYVGMSSTGADESTVGFILVNSHTKQAKFYKQSGATETAARQSAEGAVQEKEYMSSHTILYNVGGIPTYFMTLKDKGGLNKAMAFVSVINHQTVGVGETVETALRSYQRALITRGASFSPDAQVSSMSITGTVLRVGDDGKGNYYFVISGKESKAFTGGSALSTELLLTKVGDKVTVSYNDGENEIVDMTSFDNLEILFQKTPAAAVETAGKN